MFSDFPRGGPWPHAPPLNTLLSVAYLKYSVSLNVLTMLKKLHITIVYCCIIGLTSKPVLFVGFCMTVCSKHLTRVYSSQITYFVQTWTISSQSRHVAGKVRSKHLIDDCITVWYRNKVVVHICYRDCTIWFRVTQCQWLQHLRHHARNHAELGNRVMSSLQSYGV